MTDRTLSELKRMLADLRRERDFDLHRIEAHIEKRNRLGASISDELYTYECRLVEWRRLIEPVAERIRTIEAASHDPR